jgi:hypothetical protein
MRQIAYVEPGPGHRHIVSRTVEQDGHLLLSRRMPVRMRHRLDHPASPSLVPLVSVTTAATKKTDSSAKAA